MSHNSATATYSGVGLTVSGWQSRAEARNAQPDDCDMTGSQGQEIRLEGETGQNEFTTSGGEGMHKGERVPNFSPVHLSTPPATRSLPSSLTTNPLTAARGKR